MHVFSKPILRQFWKDYPDAENLLQAWHKKASKIAPEHFVELKKTFPTADAVGKLVVFDIGQKYRLIAHVNYAAETLYVRSVLTHKDYDKDYWKTQA